MLPDGRLASAQRSIRLWDVNTGAEVARLEGHEFLVAALAVMPDGRLVSGSYDKTIRLWDTSTAKESVKLEAPANVISLVGLYDGHLASGLDDNTIRLWDLTTAKETARLNGHGGPRKSTHRHAGRSFGLWIER